MKYKLSISIFSVFPSVKVKVRNSEKQIEKSDEGHWHFQTSERFFTKNISLFNSRLKQFSVNTYLVLHRSSRTAVFNRNFPAVGESLVLLVEHNGYST